MIMGVTKLAIFMAIKQKAEFFMQDPSFVNNAESKFRFFFLVVRLTQSGENEHFSRYQKSTIGKI